MFQGRQDEKQDQGRCEQLLVSEVSLLIFLIPLSNGNQEKTSSSCIPLLLMQEEA